MQYDDSTRHGLADALDRRRDDIVERWLARVNADIVDTAVSRVELENAMPDYLRGLSVALRAGDVTIERGAEIAWRDVVEEHALTRVHLGFDVDQLVHEFIVLRRVLAEIAREESCPAPGGVLAELVEAGITLAVAAYVRARDHEARRTQAENVAFITHELRNPLNTATLAAQALRDAVGHDPQHLALIERLERSHRRLLDLISDVIQLHRADAKALRCEPVEIRLDELLREPLATLHRAAAEKNLEVTERYDPAAVVRVDPVLTRSAVENLLDNAVKYTDRGHVHLKIEVDDESVVFHVRDTGSGLSPSELRTIFEPFVRKHTHKPGTGLGLSVVRRAAQAQGGRAHAESTEGQGSHFWFELPRPAQPSEAA